LQLAATFIAAEQRPSSLEMITLDDRLASAAQTEGFAVIDIATDEALPHHPSAAISAFFG
jgi:hypothetical protein